MSKTKNMKMPALLAALGAALWALPAGPAQAQGEPYRHIRVFTAEAGDKVYVCAANDDPYGPGHVKIEMPGLVNMQFSAPLPLRMVIPPQQSVTLGYLTVVDPHRSSQYRIKDITGFGDPTAVPDKDFTYLFPYEHGVKHEVNQGYFGKVTHQSCYCLDFDLKEGSPICAARGGVVVRVKQDSNVGGLEPRFQSLGNHVWIMHSDGTWAQYEHLQLNGARVQLGQRVEAGQVIGLSGHTGEAKGPHLHFQVSTAAWEGENGTIPTKFLGKDGVLVSAEEGKFYYSYHPGGAPFTEVNAQMYSEDQLDQVVKDSPLDGAVTLKSWPLDDRILFYCANGTQTDKIVTVNFRVLQGYTCSKPLPFTKTVPAGKMVYFLNIQRGFTYGNTQYGYSLSWH